MKFESYCLYSLFQAQNLALEGALLVRRPGGAADEGAGHRLDLPDERARGGREPRALHGEGGARRVRVKRELRVSLASFHSFLLISALICSSFPLWPNVAKFAC